MLPELKNLLSTKDIHIHTY